MTTPGQAAYKAWRESVKAIATGNATHLKQVADFLDSVTPAWEMLADSVRDVWEVIADAAITAYEDPEGLGPIARDMSPEDLARLRTAVENVSALPSFVGTLKNTARTIMHQYCTESCGPECDV